MDKEQLLEDLFRAYYDARKNKRNTMNQLRFEINFEQELFLLYDDIMQRSYVPNPSICFIVDYPVKREIFAADFRDRVVHHLLYNYLNPVLEKLFIDDSYSCRKGKGTLFGIHRIEQFIKECSGNYTKDCYILKLDIRGYFMSINKQLLWKQLQSMLKDFENKNFSNSNDFKDMLFWLLKIVIFHDSRDNCIVKGNKSDWEGLPLSKSLFHSPENCGLPIGNLTSQLFSNVYLHDFDQYVKNDLGVKYYGRYVDDFVIIHSDKEVLKKMVLQLGSHLKKALCLELHPKKIYLQHYSKGVSFLGSVIKPHRLYIANKTKSSFLRALKACGEELAAVDTKLTREKVRARINSYLGIMQHFKCYNIKRKYLYEKPHQLYQYGYFTNGFMSYKLDG